MLGILVGLTEIGLGLGKLGFVADLLSKEVQVGYMNGLAITIIVGQLPKLFGFSTSADSFLKEVRVFFEGLDQTELHDAARRPRRARPAARAAAHHPARAGRARGGGGSDRRLGAVGALEPRRQHGGGAAAGGSLAQPSVDERAATSGRCWWRPWGSRWSR